MLKEEVDAEDIAEIISEWTHIPVSKLIEVDRRQSPPMFLSKGSIEIFFCYAHEDEALLNKLKTHLNPLQRQRLIDVWHDRDISAGTEWKQEIDEHLNRAQIILLLISPDFIASDYCYDKEMKRALERHNIGEAWVIPIILRPTDLKNSPFMELQALPTNAMAVTAWEDRDEAFLDIAKGIRKVVEEMTKNNILSRTIQAGT